MGLFDKAFPSAEGIGIQPLSHDRIAAALDRDEANYGRDEEDGHCYGMWDGHPFRFHARGERGEMLMIRAFWSPEPPATMRPQFLELCNEWSASRLFPKVYVEDREERLWLVCELSVDLEHGVSDKQLDQLMTCAIATSGQFFEFLQEKFPQYAEWEPNPEG